MFQGKYNDKQKHDPDFDLVVERALAAGVERMIGMMSDRPPRTAGLSWFTGSGSRGGDRGCPTTPMPLASSCLIQSIANPSPSENLTVMVIGNQQ